jgi:PAS domain S-box-containing protein
MVASTATLARRSAWTDAGFALALAVVVAIAATAAWTFEEHARASHAVAHTEQVRDALAEARWALADLRARELAAFLQPRAWAPPDDATLRARLDAVRNLTVDNASQQARLAEADRSLAALVAHLGAQRDAGAASPSSDGRAAAAAETDRGFRALNARLVDLDAEEQQLLVARVRASEEGLRWLAWSIGVLVAVLAVLLPLLYRNVRRGQKQEDALRRSEQRLRLLAQNVTDYAIIMLDPSGRVVSWNDGAQRLKGWSADEVVGRHFSTFYPAEDAVEGKPERALAHAASAGRYQDEGWRMRKDGSCFWASAVITALREPGGEIGGFLKITRDLTDRRKAEEALREEVAETHRVERALFDANQSLEWTVAHRTAELTAANAEIEAARGRLQDLSAHLIESQEDERRRIARELHDETGQALTTIKLRLNAGLRDGVLAATGIGECVALVDATIRQIRQLSLDLRPLMLDDLGLADALEAMLQRVGETAHWVTTLNVDHLPDGVAGGVETACFRIVQEALTNAARHAAASSVEVGLQQVDGELVVTVRDDGAGFDPASLHTPAMRRAHFGLVSMTERASLAGGALVIESSPGRGTIVRASFPLKPPGAVRHRDVGQAA